MWWVELLDIRESNCSHFSASKLILVLVSLQAGSKELVVPGKQGHVEVSVVCLHIDPLGIAYSLKGGSSSNAQPRGLYHTVIISNGIALAFRKMPGAFHSAMLF